MFSRLLFKRAPVKSGAGQEMSDRRRQATQTGGRTLEMFSGTPQLNAWMISKFRDRVRGTVLEIGSGIGNLSGLLRERADELVVTDVEDHYVEALSQRFAGDPRVSAALYNLDEEPPAEVSRLRYDAIVAVNVLEHVADDVRAVRRLVELLKPGGHLLIYVPAMPFLFGSLDEALGHYRRYTRASLRRLLTSAGLEVPEPRYMNVLGTAGWFLQGRILRKRTLAESQVHLFERLVPLCRQEDRFRLPFGLGVVALACSPGTERPVAEQRASG